MNEIVKFLRSLTTWFDTELDGDLVILSTREHGNVGEETVGDEDIAEARRIITELKAKFPKAKIDAEAVDEWVTVTVTA